MADVFKVQGTVSLDTSSFNSEVDKASQAGKKLASDLDEQSGKIKGSLENAFAVSVGNILSDIAQEAARYMLDFAKESVAIASDLQEVQNVVDVTFGEGAKQLEAWAKSARTQFGLTELQAKQYASTMGAMLKSMGMTETQAYDMSTAMAGLAADMASFYNIDFDDAFAKIRSGISGETEPLKQLGINLNVANLEAFALSRGITKTYESMTLAEQATLRYMYLMNATADAQGDFARTSDSYANNLRLAETNINSLKASIGDGLLPVMNGAVSVFNSFFDNERSVIEQMADADAAFENSASAIAMKMVRANALIDVLEELSQKETLTNAETAQWNDAVRQLTADFPSLKGMIGETAGTFATSAEAIRDETKALQENALEAAKQTALREQMNAWADALAASAIADTNAKVAHAQLVQKESEIKELTYSLLKKYGVDESQHERIYQDVLRAQGVNNAILGLGDRGGATYEELEALRLAKEEHKNYNKVALESYAAQKELNEQLTEAEEKYHSVEQALSEMGEVAKTTNEDASGGGTGGVAGTLEGMTNNTLQFESALKDLQKEGKSVQKMFDEIEQYKLDNLEGIKKKVEGVYDSFDKVDKVGKQSGKKMLGNNEDQVKQLERFSEAYKQLQEAGASDQLMSEFDYSPESIAQMEAILKDIDSGKRSIEDYNTSVSELQTKQDEVAAMLAETSNKVDTTLAEMQTKADTANAELTAKMTTVVEAASTMQATVTTASDTATGKVGELQTAGDALGLSEWEPTIDAEDNATSVIDTVKKALEKLDGTTVTTYIKTVNTGDVDASNAKGLGYVPYDGYISELHRGEEILSAAEANIWRKNKKASSDQPITVNLTVNGVSSNPYEIAGEVRNALELLRWQS